MQIVNIHDAKTNLSKLVAQAASGEPFIIAKSGMPLVKVIPLNAPEGNQVRRLGFMSNQIQVPDDFDQMGSSDIEHLFGGDA
jgi:prevent-host-death family protein